MPIGAHDRALQLHAGSPTKYDRIYNARVYNIFNFRAASKIPSAAMVVIVAIAFLSFSGSWNKSNSFDNKDATLDATHSTAF